MTSEWLTTAQVEVGEHYRIALGNKEYDAEVTLRTLTHTYIKHKHGELALPNNTSIDLIKFYERKTI